MAEERDALKAQLAASEAARAKLEAERDAAHGRITAVERSAELRVAAVREAAAQQVAAAQAERIALEALLTHKLDELARVRALYTRLVDDADDADDADEASDDSPARTDERLDLERLADKLLGYGERLGILGPRPPPGSEADDGD